MAVCRSHVTADGGAKATVGTSDRDSGDILKEQAAHDRLDDLDTAIEGGAGQER